MAYRRKSVAKKKRQLTPEQLEKMKAGREAAAVKRAEEAKTRERVAMLSDLDERLTKARRESSRPSYLKPRRRHRHHS